MIIDDYAYKNKLSKVNPNMKFAIGMLLLILSLINPYNYISLLVIGIMSFVIVGIAKIELKDYIHFIRIPFVFLILSIIMILLNFSKDKESLLYSINIGSLYIGVSNESIVSSTRLFFRALSCLTCIYFIMLTTPFNQLIFVFKKLHLPDIVLEISMLMYRFIFIFMEEVADIRKSQELRFGYINLKNAYNSFGLLVNMLFKRMMIRYDEMSIALDMKLYDGTFYIVEED
ncbi:MAG: cobalt ECF transporter T component CbiQ [Terrisporobacter othiniensis]|uniref:cobalt ECF transporter T component CbiQ n=1 Tax=Terrisporobacter petrolearius TaxID=1460447 RepID=UPI0022E40D6E|nr:cobalt ECF transporter T component CbiQ [Terrisporobacter petrolearius]MDU4861788.1 cobalt ECF transporter T component CbiQ [Terrisporobacter othiniensis]MDU6995048.1 cobalt ECF transporter T component CbiQ [Terrisporobacter othiniensis]